jgi:hypothetical protein
VLFIIFTVIGTLSHEYGHIAVAQFFGYKTTLHYASMNYDMKQVNDELQTIYLENKEAILNNQAFPRKEEWHAIFERRQSDSLYISIGGPAQTILTGLIGLSMLLYRRRFIHVNGMKTFDWLAVLLSLFWLREICNLVLGLGEGIIRGNGRYFWGDEAKINHALGLSPGLIPISFGVIGLAIALYVIFKIIPYNERRIFIMSGFIGGGIGFFLWMFLIGPQLLP